MNSNQKDRPMSAVAKAEFILQSPRSELGTTHIAQKWR